MNSFPKMVPERMPLRQLSTQVWDGQRCSLDVAPVGTSLCEVLGVSTGRPEAEIQQSVVNLPGS